MSAWFCSYTPRQVSRLCSELLIQKMYISICYIYMYICGIELQVWPHHIIMLAFQPSWFENFMSYFILLVYF